MRRRDFITTTIGAGILTGVAPALPQSAPAPAQEKGGNPFAPRFIPIGPEERTLRLEKARRLMASAGIDALILEGGTTLRYFTGARWGRSERSFLMVLPSRGEPWFLAPKFEESRAAEQVAPSPLYTWEEDESPYDILRKVMTDRGMGASTIALEESTRYFVTEGIANRLSSAKIVNGTPVTAGCRAVKSPAEIALMQTANDITAEVYRQSVPLLKPGMTEREFGRILSKKFSDFGASGGALVLFGEASAHPHGLEKEGTLREGDIVLIDGGCTVEEYVSDVTEDDRPRHADGADDEGVRHRPARPAGGPASRAARRTGRGDRRRRPDRHRRGGFGPGYRYFTHRLGHGIGMEGHEWFYLVRGNSRPETAGETHSNEPGIYIPGEFGVRIEDEMVITEDGARLMLPSPSGLGSMFG